jgi:hypothetical protein
MSTTFVRLTEAADDLGVSSNTIKRRFRSLDLSIFLDSRDLRRRLIRRTDLDAAFGHPLPTARRASSKPAPPQKTALAVSASDRGLRS